LAIEFSSDVDVVGAVREQVPGQALKLFPANQLRVRAKKMQEIKYLVLFSVSSGSEAAPVCRIAPSRGASTSVVAFAGVERVAGARGGPERRR